MTGFASAAALKGFDLLLGQLVVGASGPVKRSLAKWQTRQRAKDLYRKIHLVRNVKTIWQIDREVDLYEFYFPVKIAEEKKARVVSRWSELSGGRNVVVQGTVGQGKSIFLRYLCCEELQASEHVPCFIELRRWPERVSLETFIRQHLEQLGFPSSDAVYEHLASSGKLVLFLDGFDEVTEALRLSCVVQLEHLISKHDKLRVVVSSRPDSGIERSPHFRVVRLALLERADVESMILKLMPEDEVASHLLARLRTAKSDVAGLLTTPLMVTLLLMTYRAEQKLPEQLSEFYENLFPTLLSRHDASKPGFARRRAANLNDIQMRGAFETICFLARQANAVAPPIEAMHTYASKALELTSARADAEALISDLRRITCLIVEEGRRFHFVHKSVAEFHAACFIRGRPDTVAKEFYERVARGHWSRWREELVFLSQIDRYRFNKHYLLRDIGNLLGDAEKALDDKWRERGWKRFLTSLREYQIVYGSEGTVTLMSRPEEDSHYSWAVAYEAFSRCVMSIDWRQLVRWLDSQVGAREIDSSSNSPSGDFSTISGDVLLNDGSPVKDQLRNAIDKALEELWETYNGARQFVTNTDRSADIFGKVPLRGLS